jgi:uncharacterized protein
MHGTALIIFVRNPVLGQVKTRLAAGVGDEKALQVYEKLLAHTQSVASAADCHRYVFYADFLSEKDGWSSALFEKRMQPQGNLGHRMQAAFEEVLAQHSKAVIIGSDCYELTVVHLQQAFELLAAHDFVIGPAADGGYYLLGMKPLHPKIFEGIRWSSGQVFAQTQAQIKNLRLSYAVTEVLNDVDVAEDVLRYPGLL